MTRDPQDFLQAAVLDALAAKIDRARALPWPQPASGGDTVWLGAIDAQGIAVELHPEHLFRVRLRLRAARHRHRLAEPRRELRARRRRRAAAGAGRKPFHTLNPALALFDDGRTMVYGTMGGEGQPQTQAALFSRYAMFGQGLQAGDHRAALAARQDLGRGQRLAETREALRRRAVSTRCAPRGHDVETARRLFERRWAMPARSCAHADGVFEGGSDPRSDGAAMGF